MSHLDDASKRFSMIEMDPIPDMSPHLESVSPADADGMDIEWEDHPVTETTIQPILHNPAGGLEVIRGGRKYSVQNGHSTLQAALESLPELRGTVHKEPLYTAAGLEMPGAYGTVRHNPDGTKDGLGVVGSRYRIIQPYAALPMVKAVSHLMNTWNVGIYGAKEWIYGQGDTFTREIVPGDAVEARVLVGNSHDGSIPWSFGFPGNRVVCQNTFHMALSSKLSKLCRVRHTKNADEILAQIQQAVDLFGYEFITATDKMAAMARVKVDEDQLQAYTGYVFSQWADSEESEEETAGNRVYAKVLENFESGRGSEYSRGTLWGAYNAVTEYVSHQRSRTTDESKQFADLQWGGGALALKRAWSAAENLL